MDGVRPPDDEQNHPPPSHFHPLTPAFARPWSFSRSLSSFPRLRECTSKPYHGMSDCYREMRNHAPAVHSLVRKHVAEANPWIIPANQPRLPAHSRAKSRESSRPVVDGGMRKCSAGACPPLGSGWGRVRPPDDEQKDPAPSHFHPLTRPSQGHGDSGMTCTAVSLARYTLPEMGQRMVRRTQIQTVARRRDSGVPCPSRRRRDPAGGDARYLHARQSMSTASMKSRG